MFKYIDGTQGFFHFFGINNNAEKISLIDKLLNDQSYHIEFNGHLTNHNKHAVIALAGLGASQKRIEEYYKNYAIKTPYGYGLEPAITSKHIITQDNWLLYLGKRTSFTSYCQFFDKKEKELGIMNLLNEYVPKLISGWPGAFTHATIHLGWALDISNRCMIIEGLAYMAYSFVSCHPERILSALPESINQELIFDSILNIAEIWENKITLQNSVKTIISENYIFNHSIHPELLRSGLQYKIAKLLTEGNPIFYHIPRCIDNQDIHITWQQLYYLVTLLYLYYSGDFIILHLVTSLYAIEKIANCMPIEQQKYIAKCFWIGMLSIILARGEFPNRSKLSNLDLTYSNLIDSSDISEEYFWKDIISKAIDEEEEHNPKMVYVLRQIWKASGYHSIFRIAANFFTTTPELPKSFDMPPIIYD